MLPSRPESSFASEMKYSVSVRNHPSQVQGLFQKPPHYPVADAERLSENIFSAFLNKKSGYPFFRRDHAGLPAVFIHFLLTGYMKLYFTNFSKQRNRLQQMRFKKKSRTEAAIAG